MYRIYEKDYRPLTTLGELIADKHPELWQAFSYHTAPITLAASDYEDTEREGLRRLMEEPPRPGRGGA
jgi:hypothetical protein